jgi:hypothetical protein
MMVNPRVLGADFSGWDNVRPSLTEIMVGKLCYCRDEESLSRYFEGYPHGCTTCYKYLPSVT